MSVPSLVEMWPNWRLFWFGSNICFMAFVFYFGLAPSLNLFSSMCGLKKWMIWPFWLSLKVNSGNPKCLSREVLIMATTLKTAWKYLLSSASKGPNMD